MNCCAVKIKRPNYISEQKGDEIIPTKFANLDYKMQTFIIPTFDAS